MTERIYRLIIGLLLLGILYLDWRAGLYALITLLVFEAVTNWRIPGLISRFRHGGTKHIGQAESGRREACRFNFEAERALRLLFSGVLVVTYVLFNEQLWLFPWFAGFALAVAGLSGICPMLLFLEKLGFRPSETPPLASH
jgi:hypothetical protein